MRGRSTEYSPDYRGINIMGVAGKVFVRIIKERLENK
jgi:hypothetical protein